MVVTAEAPSPVPATAGLHGWRAALCRAWLHQVLLKASLRLGVGKIAALPSPSDACTTRLLPGQDHLRSLPDYIDGRRHGRQCELDGQWCQNAENMQDFHNLSHMGAALGLPSEFQAWDVWACHVEGGNTVDMPTKLLSHLGGPWKDDFVPQMTAPCQLQV